MKRIVFVCTGNTCRSAMAQRIAAKILKDRGVGDITVTSCGLAPNLGAPMNESAVAALREIGIDPRAHKAKKFGQQYAKDGNLVVCMTTAHKEHLPYGNVFTLAELSHGKDVEDPFGGDMASYRRTRDLLVKQIGQMITELLA